mmetsp:Transcript_25409/g.85360  ORF Transcript_25409/g.85360 Transcript_25409/m.85360 type:complete len:435 (-) Transcript_25409:96-1400(-)
MAPKAVVYYLVVPDGDAVEPSIFTLTVAEQEKSSREHAYARTTVWKASEILGAKTRTFVAQFHPGIPCEKGQFVGKGASVEDAFAELLLCRNAFPNTIFHEVRVFGSYDEYLSRPPLHAPPSPSPHAVTATAVDDDGAEVPASPKKRGRDEEDPATSFDYLLADAAAADADAGDDVDMPDAQVSALSPAVLSPPVCPPAVAAVHAASPTVIDSTHIGHLKALMVRYEAATAKINDRLIRVENKGRHVEHVVLPGIDSRLGSLRASVDDNHAACTFQMGVLGDTQAKHSVFVMAAEAKLLVHVGILIFSAIFTDVEKQMPEAAGLEANRLSSILKRVGGQSFDFALVPIANATRGVRPLGNGTKVETFILFVLPTYRDYETFKILWKRLDFRSPLWKAVTVDKTKDLVVFKHHVSSAPAKAEVNFASLLKDAVAA